MKTLTLAAVVLVLLVGIFLHRDWTVNGANRLVLPEITEVKYTKSLLNETSDYRLYKVVLDREVYGLLYEPLAPRGSIVLLPGGGVKKEQEGLARTLGVNYAVLTIDQRGIGETDGHYPDLTEDFRNFANGATVTRYLEIKDALRSLHFMRSNYGPTVLMGESMGGRIALIAATLDKTSTLVVAISSAGFGLQGGEATAVKFIWSIDPDNYMTIGNDRLVFLHSTADTIVPYSLGQATFSRAREPKAFHTFECPYHGFCDEMLPTIVGELTDFYSSR